MIRTQIQLTESQLSALRRISAATGRSIADLVRQGVEQFLAATPQATAAERFERAARVAGRFSSGAPDGSADHDRHLAEAYRQ